MRALYLTSRSIWTVRSPSRICHPSRPACRTDIWSAFDPKDPSSHCAIWPSWALPCFESPRAGKRFHSPRTSSHAMPTYLSHCTVWSNSRAPISWTAPDSRASFSATRRRLTVTETIKINEIRKATTKEVDILLEPENSRPRKDCGRRFDRFPDRPKVHLSPRSASWKPPKLEPRCHEKQC